jgi:hypothetical protein
MNSEITKTTITQIISPTFGVIRNDPLEAIARWAAAACMTTAQTLVA